MDIPVPIKYMNLKSRLLREVLVKRADIVELLGEVEDKDRVAAVVDLLLLLLVHLLELLLLLLEDLPLLKLQLHLLRLLHGLDLPQRLLLLQQLLL